MASSSADSAARIRTSLATGNLAEFRRYSAGFESTLSVTAEMIGRRTPKSRSEPKGLATLVTSVVSLMPKTTARAKRWFAPFREWYGRAWPAPLRPDISGINYRHFPLRKIHFHGIVFERCYFGRCNQVTFSNCGFLTCQFDSTFDGDLLVDVTFFRCRIEDTTLSGRLRDVSFGRTDFRRVSFLGSSFVNKLTLKSCWYFVRSVGLWETERDLAMVEYEGNSSGVFRDAVNWSRLRFLLQLPIANLSYVGLALTGTLVATAFLLSQQQGQVIDLGLVRIDIGTALWLTLAESEVMQRLAQGFLASGSIAIGATLFGLSCPDVVKSYSATAWEYELRRYRYLYDAHSQQKSRLCGVGSAFVFLGLAYLLWMYGSRILEWLWIILRMSF